MHPFPQAHCVFFQLIGIAGAPSVRALRPGPVGPSEGQPRNWGGSPRPRCPSTASIAHQRLPSFYSSHRQHSALPPRRSLIALQQRHMEDKVQLQVTGSSNL